MVVKKKHKIYTWAVNVKGYRPIYVVASSSANARKQAQQIVRKEFNRKIFLTPGNAPARILFQGRMQK